MCPVLPETERKKETLRQSNACINCDVSTRNSSVEKAIASEQHKTFFFICACMQFTADQNLYLVSSTGVLLQTVRRNTTDACVKKITLFHFNATTG